MAAVVSDDYWIVCHVEYEYGWNDPPTYSYSSSQASTSKDKPTHLYKRPSLASDQPTEHKTTPPLSSASGPPLVPTIPAQKKTSSTKSTQSQEERKDLHVYDEHDFAEIIQKLYDLANGLQDRLKVTCITDWYCALSFAAVL